MKLIFRNEEETKLKDKKNDFLRLTKTDGMNALVADLLYKKCSSNLFRRKKYDKCQKLGSMHGNKR